MNNKKCFLLKLVLLILTLSMVFIVTYKAKVRQDLEEPVTASIMLLHKTNPVIRLDKDGSAIKEEFLCPVPDLTCVRIEVKNIEADEKARLFFSISEARKDHPIEEKEISLNNLQEGFVKLEFEEPLSDSENKSYELEVRLKDPADSSLEVSYCPKDGLVNSYNRDENCKASFLYNMEYANGRTLKDYYYFICILLSIFVLIAFIILIGMRWKLNQAFWPLAISLGIVYIFTFPMNSIPDEPAHIDTAYKYSNILMGVSSTGEEGTIYKRKCDALMMNMMANNLEYNHYYQMRHHFFDQQTDLDLSLIKSSYLDAGHIVSQIVYIPAALGISIGRLCHLSPLMVITLGRFFNLLIYIFFSSLALWIIPFGKNVFALIMLLPISMQQAGSTSYDAMINSLIFVFLALCFSMIHEGGSIIKKIIAFLLVLFISISKGGVYLPLCLLLLIPSSDCRSAKGAKGSCPNRKVMVVRRFALVCGLSALVAVVFLIKFRPLFMPVLEGAFSADYGNTYPLSELLRRPQEWVYLYWNTFMIKGGGYLKGVIGGYLAWYELEINLIFIVAFIFGLVLLANEEEDKFQGSRLYRLFITGIVVSSIALVWAGMLLMFTPAESTYVVGVQGRYFLVLLPLILFLTSNNEINLDFDSVLKVSFFMMLTEVLVILNVFYGIC